MTTSAARNKEDAVQPVFSVCDDHYERAHSNLNSICMNESILASSLVQAPHSLQPHHSPAVRQSLLQDASKPHTPQSSTSNSRPHLTTGNKLATKMRLSKKTSKSRTVSQELDDFVLL